MNEMTQNPQHPRQSSMPEGQFLSKSIGLISIGLGLAQLMKPRNVAKSIGVCERPALFRTVGLREIACGIGLIASRSPQSTRRWLLARFTGDLMDLGLLGSALADRRCDAPRVQRTLATVAAITALDFSCARQQEQQQQQEFRPGMGKSIHVSRSITIDRPASELYAAWRNFESLPRFMEHLESVRVLDSKHSHWVAKGPAGSHIEWDAEITDERPNEFIAWRSVRGAKVAHSGSVRFEPAAGGRGTIVRVELDYTPPAGGIGSRIAKLFGRAPEQTIGVDLHRFEQVMETGYVTSTEGQPAGRSSSTSAIYDDLVRH